MDFGSKLEELKLTSDEICRLTKAMRDETFRKLLHDYAEEISNPENKKIYEQEIKQLEQERGMDIQFIHPKSFRCLKTSDGKQKCFVNICSNELITCAEYKGASIDGVKKGVNWSIPYSLTPGRPDVDSNGRKHMIYDVVFHPDTLHIASKNARFMDLVDGTAIDGVEKAFSLTLDRKNRKVMKTKYKGTPHPAVIRKPKPGQPQTKPVDKNDPLAFPYPYDNTQRPSSSAEKAKTTSSVNKETQTDILLPKGKPTKSFEKRPSDDAPTVPHHTIKYRSVVDLQDYRCSRDSAPDPRPREIVVTIDLPLLKSAAGAELDVTEKQLVLKSSKPAYLLELDLSYPVDVDKGHAKFNKQKSQLVVTLVVLPAKPSQMTEVSPTLVTEATQQPHQTAPSCERQPKDCSATKEDNPKRNEPTAPVSSPGHSGSGDGPKDPDNSSGESNSREKCRATDDDKSCIDASTAANSPEHSGSDIGPKGTDTRPSGPTSREENRSTESGELEIKAPTAAILEHSGSDVVPEDGDTSPSESRLSEAQRSFSSADNAMDSNPPINIDAQDSTDTKEDSGPEHKSNTKEVDTLTPATVTFLQEDTLNRIPDKESSPNDKPCARIQTTEAEEQDDPSSQRDTTASSQTLLLDDTLTRIPDKEPSPNDVPCARVQTTEGETQDIPSSQGDTNASSQLLTGENINHLEETETTPDKLHKPYEDMPELVGSISDVSSVPEKSDAVTQGQKKAVRFCKKVSVVKTDEADEDDLAEEQEWSCPRPKQPPVVLLEKNPEDGTQLVITDHTTASAFSFQNSLLYDLD